MQRFPIPQKTVDKYYIIKVAKPKNKRITTFYKKGQISRAKRTAIKLRNSPEFKNKIKIGLYRIF